MTNVALSTGRIGHPNLLGSALESERIYFELGARLVDSAGAVLAWTPELVAAANGVDPRPDHYSIYREARQG